MQHNRGFCVDQVGCCLSIDESEEDYEVEYCEDVILKELNEFILETTLVLKRIDKS